MKQAVLLIILIFSLSNSYSQNIQKDSKFYYKKGVAKLNLEDYRGAMAEFNKAIELNPNDAQTYYKRADAKRGLEDYVGEMTDYTRAIELEPNNVDFYRARAVTKHLAFGDWRGAIDDYSRAIEIEPNHWDFYSRGDLKILLEDYKGAIADFDIALKLNPNNTNHNNASVYYDRGIAWIRLGEKDSGCLDFSKAGELGDEEAYRRIRQYCK